MRYRITKVTVTYPDGTRGNMLSNYVVSSMAELEKYRTAHQGGNKDIKVRFVYEEVE